MSVFVHAQGIKTVHAGGGIKKWQNSVHVVVECPLSKNSMRSTQNMKTFLSKRKEKRTSGRASPSTNFFHFFYSIFHFSKLSMFLLFQCNVKCGQGLQHRNVICRDGSGYPSTACDFAMKPASRQPCTGLICNEVEEGYSEDGGSLVEAARQKKTAPSEKEDVQASGGADHSTGNGKSKGNSG